MNLLISNGINLLIFAAILGVLVFVHEFGHFIVAKRLGIPVVEFGFGFPPRIWRFMKRGGTEYTLNAIPLGGFVRMLGEEDPSVPGGFASAKPSVRVLILLAGVTMNFVLALIVFTLTAYFTPPYVTIQTTTINEITPGTPADQVGLHVGDTIVAVNGRAIKDDFPTFRDIVRVNAGHEVTLSILRSDQTPASVTVVPRANPPANEGPLGIRLDGWSGLRIASVAAGSVADKAGAKPNDVLLFLVEPNRPLRDQSELEQYAQAHPGMQIQWRIFRDNQLGNPINVQIPAQVDSQNAALGLNLQTPLVEAPARAGQDIVTVAASIPMLIGQLFSGNVPANAFVGPVGIYQFTGEVARSGGPVALLQLLALLSLNLAVVNLLPFPALDGGRLVFVVLEWLRGGKKIDPQKEGLVHLVGLAILLGLMLIISYFDVLRLIAGQPILPSP